ncbi:hypothetical protein P872_18995 [Rhodonellum psychrophilum GCM71 = DSM 17998]|uniref:Uncharacterized protein n=1 Tax=Rhodonellum psychrophilum GCM71 = DSM 17998 TaxID=1123057 RepID=U5C266_9BACT|nr:hypothetical protein P872_18995 [Rhodonellum psychrophilum GCM71 = DSM 17998]
MKNGFVLDVKSSQMKFQTGICQNPKEEFTGF